MTVVSRGNNVLIGGDAFADYFFPVTYPLSLAATNSYWTSLSPYDGLNIAGGAVLYDGNVILYGGSDGTAAQSAVLAYSLSGDTTPAMPSMNAARAYLGYAPDKSGNAYAFGGLDADGNPLASVERLNPGAKTPAWSYVASLPAPRYDFPAVFNRTNYIYVFGGYTDTSSGVESADALRYSVSGNNWSNLTAMPVAVAGSAATLGPDGKIYVVGGTSGGVSTSVVQVYDPASNSWTLATPLPESLSLAAVGVDSLGRLLVMGGLGSDGYEVADVWRSQRFGVPDSAPVLTQYPATTATYQQQYTSSLIATGSPPPTYSLVSGPAGMQVDYYTGAITWTPQGLDQIGLNPVTVQASNYAGSTNWSFTISVPNPPPSLVTNLTVVSVTENSVTLTWAPEDPAVGATTFTVAIGHPWHDPKGSGGGINYQVVGSTSSTNFTISGLAANTSYIFGVMATGPGGATGYKNTGAKTLPAPTPTNLHVTGLTSTTISLAWDPPVGPVPVVSYDLIGVYDGVFVQYPLGFANIYGTSVTVTGLKPGNAILWGVAAYDVYGNVSGYDYLPSLAINPAPTPAALTASTASQPVGGFSFTVQASAVQTTLIQATTTPGDPSSWVTIATNPPSSTTFTFTDTNASQFPMRFYRTVSQ